MNTRLLLCILRQKKERKEMRNGGVGYSSSSSLCVLSLSLSLSPFLPAGGVGLMFPSALPPSSPHLTQCCIPPRKKGIRKRKGLEVETKEEWRENSFPSAGEGGGGQSGEVEEGGRAIGRWRKASAFRSPFLFFFYLHSSFKYGIGIFSNAPPGFFLLGQKTISGIFFYVLETYL